MQSQRYHALAIFLHWLMALAFFGMLGSGLVMANLELPPADKFNLYQAHKSLGVLLLFAFFARLAVRWVFRPPALPQSMKKLEQSAAKFGHLALYAMMLMMPLSGWIMVSSSIYGLPTIVFGLFNWPHWPGVAGNTQLSDIAGEIHEWAAYSFIALILVHIAAVIKHRIIDKENLLKRMLWNFSK